MKRSFPVLLFALIPVFTFVSVSHAQYSIIQVANNLSQDPYHLFNDPHPKINDIGYVVWRAWDYSGGFDIFLYDGSSTTQLTNNDYVEDYMINDDGYVVFNSGWVVSDREIFLYDGTSTAQLTDNDYADGILNINGNGYVVWTGCDGIDCQGGTDGDWEIFLYNETSTTQLTDNDYDDIFPQINDNGYVVWQGCDGGSGWHCSGGDSEIFLYNGTSTAQLTNNDYDDMYPQINHDGYVVWIGGDYDEKSTWEIFLYDGASTTQLTIGELTHNRLPHINDHGYVVWQGCDGSECWGEGYDNEIFLYDGTTTTQLTTSEFTYNTAPQINNNGNVVWRGSDGSHFDIFLYDGASTTRITNNNWMDSYPRMNDRGEIVWWTYQTDPLNWDAMIYPQIRLAIPCSLEDDNDGDGYVSVACGGDDCADGNPDVNPGMSESEVTGNCSDGKDNDCDGSPDCNDPDCPACPASCAGNAVASTLGATSMHGASDLGKHLAFFLLPVGAVIGLRIWDNRKR